MPGALAEAADLLGINEQIVVALASEVPREGGHGLDAQLNRTEVDLGQGLGHPFVESGTLGSR